MSYMKDRVCPIRVRARFAADQLSDMLSTTGYQPHGPPSGADQTPGSHTDSDIETMERKYGRTPRCDTESELEGIRRKYGLEVPEGWPRSADGRLLKHTYRVLDVKRGNDLFFQNQTRLLATG